METSGHGDGAGQLDFAVACWMWMVPGRLGAWLPAFVVLWNAWSWTWDLIGCCLLDGTRLPAFVECFSSRMLLWVVTAASKYVASEVFICR